MQIDAVFFDADGVLQRPTHDRRSLLAKAFGCSLGELGGWERELFAIEEHALTGAADFEEGVRELLVSRACPGTWEMVLRGWTAIEVSGPVLALMGRLREAGVGCFLASNQERHRAMSMSRDLGFDRVFDREFYSFELLAAKPDARFFRTLLKETDLPGTRTLFVDDRPENVAAARSVGMHAEQVDLSSTAAVVARTLNLPEARQRL